MGMLLDQLGSGWDLCGLHCLPSQRSQRQYTYLLCLDAHIRPSEVRDTGNTRLLYAERCLITLDTVTRMDRTYYCISFSDTR